MGGPVEVAGDQLRAIVERIEHVEEEIKEGRWSKDASEVVCKNFFHQNHILL